MTTRPRRIARLPRTAATGVLLGLLAATTLSACAGGADETAEKNEKADSDGDGAASPEEVMDYAKELLDGTSGVDIRLATTDEPDSGDYLSSAQGTLTAAPAFEGTVAGRVMGFNASDIAIVSVGGRVWIDVPIEGWTDKYQPDDFCAPDPALLLDPDKGVSTVLTESEDLEAGEAERGGDDNEEILTPYTGSVPAEAIRNILPCSETGDFEATYRVDGKGYLRSADITGKFFPGNDPLTYTIEVLDYDVEQEITAPE